MDEDAVLSGFVSASREVFTGDPMTDGMRTELRSLEQSISQWTSPWSLLEDAADEEPDGDGSSRRDPGPSDAAISRGILG
jgi:hypothetical protein